MPSTRAKKRQKTVSISKSSRKRSTGLPASDRSPSAGTFANGKADNDDDGADPNDRFASFTAWSRAQGIDINGVRPADISGRGTGLITTRRVKEGERLLFIPEKAFIKPVDSSRGEETVSSVLSRAVDSKSKTELTKGNGGNGIEGQDGEAGQVSSHDQRKVKDLSPQAHLGVGMSLLRQTSPSTYQACQPFWPDLSWLSENVLGALDPLTGLAMKDSEDELDREIWDLMPLCLRGPVERMRRDAYADLDVRETTQGGRDWAGRENEQARELLYHWTVANTRCFSWKPEGVKQGRMVMCPFLDFVNHAAMSSGEACNVMQTKDGYSLTAHRDFDAGEEVLATYGAHTNDKLLVHYGFMIPDSLDDAILLDEAILPLMTSEQKQTLQDVGYLGNYNLDPNTMELCYRTQVAVRSILLTANEWEFFLGSGDDVAEDKSQVVKKWLSGSLRGHVDDGRRKIERLQQIIDEANGSQRQTIRCQNLIERWKQIGSAMDRYLDAD